MQLSIKPEDIKAVSQENYRYGMKRESRDAFFALPIGSIEEAQTPGTGPGQSLIMALSTNIPDKKSERKKLLFKRDPKWMTKKSPRINIQRNSILPQMMKSQKVVPLKKEFSSY